MFRGRRSTISFHTLPVVTTVVLIPPFTSILLRPPWDRKFTPLLNLGSYLWSFLISLFVFFYGPFLLTPVVGVYHDSPVHFSPLVPQITHLVDLPETTDTVPVKGTISLLASV